MWVQSLGGGKIPWRRKWQPTPVSFPWKVVRTEEPGGLQSMGLQKRWTRLSVRLCVYTHTHTHTHMHMHMTFRILVPEARD